MEHIILKLIHSDRDPTNIDDQNRNLLIGQPWFNILKDTYYICLSNEINLAIWKKLEFNLDHSTNLRIGKTNFLGNSNKKYINTGLNAKIDYIAITPLENTFGNLGNVSIDIFNDMIQIQNSGTYQGSFCWFVLGSNIKTYSLTIITTNDGTVQDLSLNINTNNRDQYILEENTNINLTTINTLFAEFDEWVIYNSINPLNFNIIEDIIIIAKFRATQYKLTIQKIGNGNGTITSNDLAINCGFTCEYYYPPHTTINLTAIADDGFQVVGWVGANIINGNEATVILDSDKTIQVIFGNQDFDIPIPELQKYNIDISINGNGQVTSFDGNISCPSNCIYEYTKFDHVILNAIPQNHYIFSSWSSDYISNNDTINFLVTNNMNISANFIIKKYKLNIVIDGHGYIDGDILTYVNFNQLFDYGTSFNLLAISFSDSYFIEFDGDITTTNSNISFDLISDINIICKFRIKTHSFQINNNGNGNIISIGNSINCSDPVCNYNFINGTNLFLEANSQIGQTFINWVIGSDIFTNNKLLLLINNDLTINANFEILKYLLKVINNGNGKIISLDGFIDCETQCEHEYNHNTSIELQAIPNIGYSFSGWSGDINNTTNQIDFQIISPMTIYATFIETIYNLLVNINGTGKVLSLDGNIDCPDINCDYNYPNNELVTLQPISLSGFIFKEWIGYDSIDLHNNCLINITEDKQVTAIFDIAPNIISYGYVSGGQSGPFLNNIIERFTFPLNSGDTIDNIAILSQNKRELSGCNSSQYFYICGGNQLYGTNLSTIDRFNFSASSGQATQINTLSKVKSKISGLNSIGYGYCCGGARYSDSYELYNDIEKFSFALDSSQTSIVNNLNIAKDSTSALNSSNYGFICGGWVANGNNQSSIERFLFLLDASPMIVNDTLTNERCECSAFNSSTYGYICGGTFWAGSGTFNNYNFVNKFNFPLDNPSCININTLSSNRGLSCGNNSSQHGYICSGYNMFNLRLIDSINFSLDGGQITHVGNLSSTKYGAAATDGTDFTNLFL